MDFYVSACDWEKARFVAKKIGASVLQIDRRNGKPMRGADSFFIFPLPISAFWLVRSARVRTDFVYDEGGVSTSERRLFEAVQELLGRSPRKRQQRLR